MKLSSKLKLGEKKPLIFGSIAAFIVIGGVASAVVVTNNSKQNAKNVSSSESTLPKVDDTPKQADLEEEATSTNIQPAETTPVAEPTPKDENTVTVEDIPKDLFGFSEYHAFKRRIEVGKPDSIKGKATGYLLAKTYCNQNSSATTPSKYAILCIPTSGTRGHMAFVEEINSDGSIRVTEMNREGWNKVSERVIPEDQAIIYRYIP